jgi:CRISPR-associated protein Cmr4
MYSKAYGVIETLAPLHVGATAGEETGNLNLIFRDQFTQTGIVPGSSIRGRLRSEMRLERQHWLEEELQNRGETIPKTFTFINVKGEEEEQTKLEWLGKKAEQLKINVPPEKNENLWYGHEAVKGEPDRTTESLVKFEYASILWLPVFCPGQPIVWVSCPRLLKRYKRITGETIKVDIPQPYTSSQKLERKKLFFNFGFVTIDYAKHDLSEWFPDNQERPAVVVGDDEIAMIHDMALYRQSRVTLEKEEKRVEEGKFFNTEALPEETILVFPIARKADKDGHQWKPFTTKTDIYLGGLESIGFGHCELTLKGV